MFFVSNFPRKLFLSRDIKTSPGPRHYLNNHFAICHWNLNSISVHNFAEVQLLPAHLAAHKFDIVHLSVTCLTPSFPFNDYNLEMPKYIIARDDHQANSKRGGVYMYYKNYIPLKVLDIRFLQENIAFDLQIDDKL